MAQPGLSIIRPSREVAVYGSYDVVVCGGGPAGVAAALAASRAGARTALIELHGCLGGVWTAGLLSNLIDHENKGGLMREIVTALRESKAQITPTCYDAEVMKLVLEQRCLEAGVDVRLHTRVVETQVQEGRLTHVLTESASGCEAWSAAVFIDATGNGDLAAQAGCAFDVGQPHTRLTQPLSLMAMVGGVPEAFLQEQNLLLYPELKGDALTAAKDGLLSRLKAQGIEPSYSRPSLFPIRDGFYALMANHEYGVAVDDAAALSAATLRARAELHRIVNALRGLGGTWTDLRLIATAEQIGIREGRRIRGLATVTESDLETGAQFEDSVCDVTFCVDIHSLRKSDGGGYSSAGVAMKPYQIPLRALVAQDIDGLMMAGRCISGDFIAHASYRVTGNAVAMGEAAGQAAAQMTQTGQTPHGWAHHPKRAAGKLPRLVTT